jgi:hypothetical protein
MSEEEYMQCLRKSQMDEYFKNSKKGYSQVELSKSKPVQVEVVSPVAAMSTITGVKVEQNKDGLRNEIPTMLDNLKRKVENKQPKMLMENKYKLFLEHYRK